MAVVTKEPKAIPVMTADGCALELRRHPAKRKDSRAVLLVHGASAGSDTFRIGETQTLVDYLLDADFDVWTLDWRASKNCAQNIYCRKEADSTIFTIDAAATHDVPAAIRKMRAEPHNVHGKIAVVGHCLGGAIVAQGIAQGVIAVADVENVVLTGLALFYKAAVDNTLKAEDRVLEQVLAGKQYLLHPTTKWDLDVCKRDPGKGDWDRLLQVPYETWRDTPLRHSCGNEFCHRISYMFGMPYLPDLIPSIHAGHLPSQFGYIPLQFLLHCCQNLRRGYAGRYVADHSGSTLPPDEGYLRRAAFQDRRITLITGDLNSLWHRDSMDTMYEWLRRGRPADQPRALGKHVLGGYGHQDLHWGRDAPRDVFPYILRGL